MRAVVLYGVYVALFWLPGFLLCGLLKVQEGRLLWSIAGSYIISLTGLIVGRAFGLSVMAMIGANLVLVVGMVIWGWRKGPWRGWSREAAKATPGISGKVVGRIRVPMWVFGGAPVLLLLGYIGGIGAYTEIPSDSWWHLGRIQDALTEIGTGRFGEVGGVKELLDGNGPHWYYFPAVSLQLSGLTLKQGLDDLAVLHTGLLLGAIYSFGLVVFQKAGVRRLHRHVLASVSVLFFALHFGVNVFSYLRYYTFAPTFFNYILYMASLVLIARCVEDGKVGGRRVAVFLILTIFMLLVHIQEAMFAWVMAFIMVLVATGRAHGRWVREWWGGGAFRPSLGTRAGGLAWAGGGGLALFISVWWYLQHVAFRSNPLSGNRLIPVHNIVPFIKNLYVLNPTYQFYQVVTIWGVFVYLLYLRHHRELLGSNILTAGMLLPIFTVFNPIFIDLFLRISYPEVVWRLCFAMTLPFVGAYFFTRAAEGIWRDGPIGKKALNVATLGLLIVLLMPLRGPFINEPYNRMITLQAVRPENDYRQWEDMLDFLNGIPPTGIITDRVTGYVINGLTPHHYPGFKFYGTGAVPYNLAVYREDSFKKKDGWLIVINLRDGGYSDVGAISRHWSPRVMEVSRHYDERFIDHIEGNPAHYKKIWEKDRIGIYRISF